MRIALLTSAKGWRGSGASYAKLARGLAGRGHVAQLVTTSARLSTWFRSEHLPVMEIPGGNTGLREIGALLKTLRSVAAEAVVVDTPRDLRLAAWATLGQRAAVIYRYNLNYRRPRTHLADRLYVKRVAACVFQSQFIQQEALRQEPWVGGIPGYRVANGYDTDRFRPRSEAARAFRQAWDIPSNAAVVLTAAKLEQGKGHEVAIAALKRVQQQRSDVIYVVCGDGARDAELRALAGDSALPARFTGLLDVDSLIAGLSAADIVVHPSLREIFPNVVGEAMACGRAVIAADAGGTGELLGRDGSSGLLVPANDPAALADAVTQVLGDPAWRARLGAAARRRVETKFSLDRMIDGYERALREVLGAR